MKCVRSNVSDNANCVKKTIKGYGLFNLLLQVLMLSQKCKWCRCKCCGVSDQCQSINSGNSNSGLWYNSENYRTNSRGGCKHVVCPCRSLFCFKYGGGFHASGMIHATFYVIFFQLIGIRKIINTLVVRCATSG